MAGFFDNSAFSQGSPRNPWGFWLKDTQNKPGAGFELLNFGIGGPEDQGTMNSAFGGFLGLNTDTGRNRALYDFLNRNRSLLEGQYTASRAANPLGGLNFANFLGSFDPTQMWQQAGAQESGRGYQPFARTRVSM